MLNLDSMFNDGYGLLPDNSMLIANLQLKRMKDKKFELKPQLFASRKDAFHPAKIEPVVNELVKPKGGLWTSTFDVEYKSKWVEFCEENLFNIPKKYWNGYLLVPSKNARIYVIDSFLDLATLITGYSYEPFADSPVEFMRRKVHLDFEAISKDYDAVHLTEEGQYATRHSNPFDLYGWDFESTIWFRDCFAHVTPVRFETSISKEELKAHEEECKEWLEQMAQQIKKEKEADGFPNPSLEAIL